MTGLISKFVRPSTESLLISKLGKSKIHCLVILIKKTWRIESTNYLQGKCWEKKIFFWIMFNCVQTDDHRPIFVKDGDSSTVKCFNSTSLGFVPYVECLWGDKKICHDKVSCCSIKAGKYFYLIFFKSKSLIVI
jgi:hypothetical protein